MRRLIGVLAGVLLLLGMMVLLYNPFLSFVASNKVNKEIREFEQVEENVQVEPSTGQTTSGNVFENLLEEMQKYNEKLYQNGQSGLTDAWSYEQAAFDFTKYGLSTEVMGILSIPAMEEELPIYLGATEENMAKGVAVLGQTSMPVGGVNTNCVIVGHRGYNGTPFFREIEKLQLGDRVYLKTYWGQKIYQVESMDIIQPDDIEAVLIQEGRELLTLVTCHPYAVGTHRYVVYCTVADDEILGENNSSQDHNWDGSNSVHTVIGDSMESSTSQRRIQLEQYLPYLAIPLVILSLILFFFPKKRERKSQKRRKDRHEKDIL